MINVLTNYRAKSAKIHTFSPIACGLDATLIW